MFRPWRRITQEIAGSFRKSEYFDLASSLHSHPLYYYVSGNRNRPDFLYVSTKTGLPLLYRFDPRDGTDQLLTPGEMPVFAMQGCASRHRCVPGVRFGGGGVRYPAVAAGSLWVWSGVARQWSH